MIEVKERGEQPGISRRWVEKATQELDKTSKQQGRTVLLASIAPYQILEEDVIKFKQEYPANKWKALNLINYLYLTMVKYLAFKQNA